MTLNNDILTERQRKCVPDVSFELIPIRNLVSNQNYQRPLSEGHIRKALDEFDVYQINPVKVSRRGGVNYVFDGQHTVLARETLEGKNSVPILCKVYEDLTMCHEAELFARQTGVSSLPTHGERLRANVLAGDDESIDFCRATERSGIQVELTGKRYEWHLSCIGTAMAMYRRLGAELYTDALNIIADSWKGEKDSLRYEIIRAVCEFVRLYKGEYNRMRLVAKLSLTDPKSICDNIAIDLIRPRNKKYVYQIYKIYSGSGKRYKLPLKF